MPMAVFSILRSTNYRGELAQQVEQAREIGYQHGVYGLLACKDYDEVPASLRGLVGGYAHPFGARAGIPEGHEGRLIVSFGQERMPLGESHVLLDPGS